LIGGASHFYNLDGYPGGHSKGNVTVMFDSNF